MTVRTLERALRYNARSIQVTNLSLLRDEKTLDEAKTRVLKGRIFISRPKRGIIGSNGISVIASPITRDQNSRMKDFSREKILPFVERHFGNLNPTLFRSSEGYGFMIKFKLNSGTLKSILISTFPAGVHFNFENNDIHIPKSEIRRNVRFWMDLIGKPLQEAPKSNGFESILDFELVLNGSWDKLTGSDPDNWSDENSSWGQCAVTSLVIQDFFGGTIIWSNAHLPGVEKPIPHYRNLIDGKEVDLTRKQFPLGTKLSKGRVKLQKGSGKPKYKTTRDYILSTPHTVLRYERLKKRVERLHEADISLLKLD